MFPAVTHRTVTDSQAEVDRKWLWKLKYLLLENILSCLNKKNRKLATDLKGPLHKPIYMAVTKHVLKVPYITERWHQPDISADTPSRESFSH